MLVNCDDDHDANLMCSNALEPKHSWNNCFMTAKKKEIYDIKLKRQQGSESCNVLKLRSHITRSCRHKTIVIHDVIPGVPKMLEVSFDVSQKRLHLHDLLLYFST